MQLFWEAFPAEGGAARTTYMFTYCDTDRQRPTFQARSPDPAPGSYHPVRAPTWAQARLWRGARRARVRPRRPARRPARPAGAGRCSAVRGPRQALLDGLRGACQVLPEQLLTADARQALLDRYFELLPEYQGAPLDALDFRRVLFGAFPTFADSPLRPQFDRILQVQHPKYTSIPLQAPAAAPCA